MVMSATPMSFKSGSLGLFQLVTPPRKDTLRQLVGSNTYLDVTTIPIPLRSTAMEQMGTSRGPGTRPLQVVERRRTVSSPVTAQC